MPNHVVEAGGQTFHLGRNPSLFDVRNLNYRMAEFAPKPAQDREWIGGPILNQGETPSCTGHGSRGWEMCLPGASPLEMDEMTVPDPRAVLIWQQAQLSGMGHLDPNDGATIHDIAKVLSDPTNKVLAPTGKPRMGSYVWGMRLDEILSYLSWTGPIIIGVTWYKSMFASDADGVVQVDSDSGVGGGHCVYMRGVSVTRKLVGPISNSWGTGWGKSGEFYIPFDQFQLLIPGGEFCAGLENPI
jgi:hypothetical protein